jgi:hypothetical protein
MAVEQVNPGNPNEALRAQQLNRAVQGKRIADGISVSVRRRRTGPRGGFLASYGNTEVSKVARELDTMVEALLTGRLTEFDSN